MALDAARIHRRGGVHRFCRSLFVVGILCAAIWSDWRGWPSWAAPMAAEAAAAPSAGKGAVVLNSRNFDSSLRNGNVWLVEFYAPWCGHCTRFASTYEQIATHFHSDQSADRKVSVGKVDGAAERALSSRFSVRGFPTFFLVDGWTVRQYNGPRSQKEMIQFVTKTYAEEDPVPFLFGPFGPMGQSRALLMWVGTRVMSLYESLLQEDDQAPGGFMGTIKPLMAMAMLCFGGMALGLFALIFVAVCLMPRVKQD